MFHAAKAISPACGWQFGKRPVMLQFDVRLRVGRERLGKNSLFATGGPFHIGVFDGPLMQTSINVYSQPGLPCDNL
jgi:hypothetical protein